MAACALAPFTPPTQIHTCTPLHTARIGRQVQKFRLHERKALRLYKETRSTVYPSPLVNPHQSFPIGSRDTRINPCVYTHDAGWPRQVLHRFVSSKGSHPTRAPTEINLLHHHQELYISRNTTTRQHFVNAFGPTYRRCYLCVHNLNVGMQELSRELAAEKKRGAHTNRKLEQSNLTSAELRESLALAQDTVRGAAALANFDMVFCEGCSLRKAWRGYHSWSLGFEFEIVQRCSKYKVVGPRHDMSHSLAPSAPCSDSP